MAACVFFRNAYGDRHLNSFWSKKVALLSASKPARFVALLFVAAVMACAGTVVAGEPAGNGSLRPVSAKAPVQPGAETAPLIELDGSISVSPDGGELTYRWEQISGPKVTLSSYHTAKPQFRTSTPGVYEFQLVVSANGLDSEPHIVRLEIERENAPPVAKLVAEAWGQVGKVLEIDGSESFDPEGEDVTYQWRAVTPGLEIPAEALSRSVLTFEPEVDGTYEVELVVSDGEKTSEPARCLLTIKPRPRPPVAQARIITVEIPAGATTTETTELSAMAAPGSTDKLPIPPIEPLPEIGTQTDAWTASEVKAGGVPNPGLTSPGSPIASATPPAPMAIPSLTTTEPPVFAVPETVPAPPPVFSEQFIPSPAAAPPSLAGDLAPMAAPDNIVWTPSPAQSMDYPELAALPYDQPHSVVAPAPPLAPQVMEPQFSVLPIIPETPSAPRPVARISAPQRAETGKVVMLDARNSYSPSGSRLEYGWRQTAGPAVADLELVLDGAAERFVAPYPGEYEFELVVSDGGVASDPVTHRLWVEKEPDPPVAVVVAPTHALPDSLVKMDATQSYDPQGGHLIYRWRQTGGPKVTNYVIDERVGDAAPAFRPSKEGLYSFSLSVFNGSRSSNPIDIDIEVTDAARRPPTLSIGGPDKAKVGERLVLNAVAMDATGWNLTYEWQQVEGPGQALSPSSGIRAMVVPPAGGRYVFTLTARDESGAEVASASRTLEVQGGRSRGGAPYVIPPTPVKTPSEPGLRRVPELTPLPNSKQTPMTFPQPQTRGGGRGGAEVLQGGKGK